MHSSIIQVMFILRGEPTLPCGHRFTQARITASKSKGTPSFQGHTPYYRNPPRAVVFKLPLHPKSRGRPIFFSKVAHAYRSRRMAKCRSSVCFRVVLHVLAGSELHVCQADCLPLSNLALNYQSRDLALSLSLFKMVSQGCDSERESCRLFTCK